MKNRFKCFNCENETFSVIKELDSKADSFYEIWECLECGTLYKVYYKMTKIVKLDEGDRKYVF